MSVRKTHETTPPEAGPVAGRATRPAGLGAGAEMPRHAGPPLAAAPVLAEPGPAPSRRGSGAGARATTGRRHRRFGGIEVYVEWHGEPEVLAHKLLSATAIGAFRLSLIANHGGVTWPTGTRQVDPEPRWRCRFTPAEGAADAEREVPWLLSVIGEHMRWLHVEKFERFDDARSGVLGEAAA